jgi:GTP-binding protein HflX
MASQLDADFLELINSLEDEMARNRRTNSTPEVRDRTILVGVATGTLTDAEESMAELAELLPPQMSWSRTRSYRDVLP